jgi:23S rRNA (cytosine1962-C5)-methyltransferase
MAQVSAVVATHVRGGYPEVTFDRLQQAPARVPRGGLVTIQDPDGDVLGWGLWDTEDRRIRILDRGAETTLDRALVRQRLAAALARREQLGLAARTDAYRLINAEGDGLPGVRVDRYGEFLVLCLASRSLGPLRAVLLPILQAELQPRGIVEKLLPRQGPPKVRVHGEPPPRRLIVTEDDLQLEVHLRGGANTGLFTDLRDERTRLRELGTGRRVLHCFSYTGTLSVALARGGASHLTLMDRAAGLHGWAARNLERAGVEPGRLRFLDQDVLEGLAGLGDERFDLVLLDPPTYSAARPSAFTLKRHLPELVRRGVQRLAPDGVLWVATSSRRHRRETIERWITKGLDAAHRPWRILARRGLPGDYPTLPCFARGHYLLVLEIAVS